MTRCRWVHENSEIYKKYHDEEWGVPSFEDDYLFEMLVLESFQAGLSWITILKKREAFRIAYDDFDVVKVASYDEMKMNELANNPDIVRNRRKIRASVKNAQGFIEIQKEFGSFSNYIWKFTEGKVIKNTDNSLKTSSSLSDEISLDLKKRGMCFVGTTIIYSYLQAIGVIDDHDLECDWY